MTKNIPINEVLVAEPTLTSAHEDYLKAIYLLQRSEETVTNSALATDMSVAPASATNMVKKLADLNLVEYIPYRGVILTEGGRKVALETLRHHRLLELYLHEALNMPWHQIHEEADRLEHVISEQLEDAIAAALGHPTVDPHGDPIPSKDGEVVVQTGTLLSVAQLDRTYRIVRVMLQDSERLSYLGQLGLYPNAQIRVIERAPFEGPLLVNVDGIQHALAFDMAACLLVDEVKD